jgi:colicin import membrane protein
MEKLCQGNIQATGTCKAHQERSAAELVRSKAAESARLHKIDVAASALDQMVQEYARQKESLEEEIAGQWSGLRTGRRVQGRLPGRRCQKIIS